MSVCTLTKRWRLLQGSKLRRRVKRCTLHAFRPLIGFGASFFLLSASGAQAWPSQSDSLHASASGGLANSIAAAGQQDAQSYYFAEVDAGVQQECLLCHKSNGAAEQSGARLVLGTSPVGNHGAFTEFLSLEDVSGDWVLAKVVGQQNHGGGAVLSQSSPLYLALREYLSLLGSGGDKPNEVNSFWEGTAAEPREDTLRRAALLFGGVVPDDQAVEQAIESEEGLRQAISDSLVGEGFKDFILRGANDRLLVEGLLNGIDFGIDTQTRYPKLAELLVSLPQDRPEEFDDYHDKPFLSRWDAEWNVRWAITREPLELIAHVIMKDLPYRQVLTASHTMVNAFTDLAYRSETGLSHEFADEQGFYDRSQYNRFVPGYNDGHIPHDHEFEAEEEVGIISFSDYQEWPHAGVLSTQAWLARYPSTDTNRNRARARWTYFHFLGVDIEASAPRTMDPDALADTNNPTMNNSACTVCHERLDPVAGAYQSFGDLGHYLDQYGGKDSLADSYKCPECYGGERGSTPYEEGDTWYRDMRAPGFEDKVAGGPRDSLQWLGYRISRDPRFAAATVRFWWPAIFGADPLVMPEDDQLPDYEAQLRAYNEQDKLINELAQRFELSGFSAKALFTDMVMSKWYRHSDVTDPELAESRLTELASVGRGRVLGPEELDRKNLAVFGRTWGQYRTGSNAHDFSRETALTGYRAPFKGFYGGIDGAVVTERNREMTPLMASLTESMASDLACQVAAEDFNRASGERIVFTDVDRYRVPGELAHLQKELAGKVPDMGRRKTHSLKVSVTTVAGPTRVRIDDLTFNSHESVDGNWTTADLTVEEILFRQGGRTIRRIEGERLTSKSGFFADRWEDEDGELHWRGHAQNGVGWTMHSNAWVEVETTLPPGNYDVEVRLGTALLENNVKEAMRVRLSVAATENIEQTASWATFAGQVQSLASRALNRQLSDDEIRQMVELVDESSRTAYKSNSRFDDRGHQCDTWSIWAFYWFTHEENMARNWDAEGMMRGWSALLHALMTSYEYLHD